MHTHHTAPRWPFLMALLAALAGARVEAQTGTAPYVDIDQVVGEFVSYNSVPRRPMVLFTNSQQQHELYAVNTQASTIVHFQALTGSATIAPTQTFHVPKSPVSIGLWTDPSASIDPDRLVVVCDGTYCVSLLKRTTGEIVGLLELRNPATGKILGEPGDLLIDANAQRAFVSCAAADAVAEINLPTFAVVRVFDLPAKDPVFLCFDPNNNDVLVAPQISGNNSGARQDATIAKSTQHKGRKVVDFAVQAIPPTRLPDSDLFRCVRSTGAVQPVTTGMGAVLFACGINPLSNRIWQLNTEANNKDPNRQTEASIQGDIVQNRLSIATFPAIGGSPSSPTLIKDLDKLIALQPYDPSLTVGQPYALSFTATGLGLITGLLTDNVTVLDSSGNYQQQIDLPNGSIPRGVLHSAPQDLILAYCWGTSKVEVHQGSGSYTHLSTLDLGYDPTPSDVQAGRTLFYDARFSLHNNASCASCHIEGATDMLCWNLGKASDDKGPMVTQTLAGIGRLVPFHWRGEQQQNLADFNPAFVNLLGAANQLDATQFAQFQSFVFSIQNRPNPFQNEKRVVDLAIQPPLLPLPGGSLPVANAVLGQTDFGAGTSCERCHSFPMGTNNDIVNTGATVGNEQNPRRQFFKNTPFNDLYKKEQDADKTQPGIQTVTITLPGLNGGANETFEYPLLGAGLSHAGLLTSLHEFIDLLFSGLPANDRVDLTGFLFQWDQGLAPAVYRGTLLDSQHFSNPSMVQSYLLPQASPSVSPNCDLVAFGTSTLGGVQREMRWWYDRGLSLFVAEDSSIQSQGDSFFLNQAQAGTGSNVFLGLPVGSGRRFAIDFDGDDLLNADEAPRGCSPTNPDTDGDGDPDGHEYYNGQTQANPAAQATDTTPPSMSAVTAMVTGKVARINVETSEPCVLTIDYALVGGGPTHSQSTNVFARTHSVLLQDLQQSTAGTSPIWMTYNGQITARDLALPIPNQAIMTSLPNMPSFNQNLNQNPPTPITTRFFQDTPANVAVIGSLSWSVLSLPVGGASRSAIADVQVNRKVGSPPALPPSGLRVLARIFVDGVKTQNFTAGTGSEKWTSFESPAGTPYTGLQGAFLVSSMTDGNGAATLAFTVQGLSAGQTVSLNIELVALQVGTTPLVVDNITTWNMPATAAANRRIDFSN